MKEVVVQPVVPTDPVEPRQTANDRGEIAITRAEARRLVNYAFMASSANWTPFIRENGVSGQDSPWVEFLRIADRLWTVLFPDHPIRQIDPRLPADQAADIDTIRAKPTDTWTAEEIAAISRTCGDA